MSCVSVLSIEGDTWLIPRDLLLLDIFIWKGNKSLPNGPVQLTAEDKARTRAGAALGLCLVFKRRLCECGCPLLGSLGQGWEQKRSEGPKEWYEMDGSSWPVWWVWLSCAWSAGIERRSWCLWNMVFPVPFSIKKCLLPFLFCDEELFPAKDMGGSVFIFIHNSMLWSNKRETWGCMAAVFS